MESSRTNLTGNSSTSHLNRSHVQRHPVLKVAKQITLNEDNGANLAKFWEKIFCKRSTDVNEEFADKDHAIEKYKEIILDDLNKI